MCKAWGSEAYRKLVALSHQVVGGIGFMEEYDLQLYFKHAKAAEQVLGDTDYLFCDEVIYMDRPKPGLLGQGLFATARLAD